MSSYLTVYGRLKEKYNVEKPIILFSVSRNSDLYQVFNENGVTYAYDAEGNEKYTQITKELLSIIKDDINGTIDKTNKRISTYEKFLPKKSEGRLDALNEILSWQEYLEDNIRTLHYIEFMEMLVEDISLNYGSFKELLCNID